MSEIIPAIVEEEDEEDGGSALVPSPDLQTLKSSLISRCKAAGLDIEDKFLPGEELQYLRVSLKAGRETRSVRLYSEDSIREFLSLPFEKYICLFGKEAICSYELGTVEAAVRPLNQLASSFIWRRLFNTQSDDELKTAKIELPPSSEGLPHVELSRPTDTFLKLLRVGQLSRGRMTLKLTSAKIKTHDAALELLEKISGALFFQLDLLTGVAFGLERERRRVPGSAGNRAFGRIENLEYPKVQYDNAPLSLYWYGRGAGGMPLLQYLAFYQAIEFYFPVFSRSEAQRKLKLILKDPTFRTDRETDIARLLSAISVSRAGAFGDEKSQLRATLMECCDPEELRQFLESDQRRKDFFSGKAKTQSYHKLPLANRSLDLRGDVAERVYEIRCKIVHTKIDARDTSFELLLPFSAEAEQLSHDIDLVQYLANRVLVSSSTSLT